MINISINLIKRARIMKYFTVISVISYFLPSGIQYNLLIKLINILDLSKYFSLFEAI